MTRQHLELSSLSIVLTAACNLRCAYCYQNAKHAEGMDWATLEACLVLVLRSSKPLVSVTFTGGEPLLQFGLIERAVRYLRSRARPGQEIEWYLLTNGILLGPCEARLLARTGFRTRISLDGAAPVQAVRAPRTFDALDELLRRLRRDEPQWFRDRISTSSVVTADTLPFLPDSMAYLLSTGVRDIVVGPALTVQLSWKREDIALLEERLARVRDLSVAHYRRTGEQPISLFRQGNSLFPAPAPSAFCGAGRSDHLTVDVDGEVCGCPLFAGSYQRFPDTPLGRAVATFHAGRVDDPDLPAALSRCRRRMAASRLFDRAGKRSSYARCTTCRYRHRCSLCPVTIVHQPGASAPDRVPDFACAFQRAVGRFQQRFSSSMPRG